MDDQERMEQVKRHQEKWKKWKQEMRKNDNLGPQNQLSGNLEQNAHNYAIKLIQKLQEPQKKDQNLLKNKEFEDQFQSNTCSICFELMVPPHKPMILFPCGHNLCKICLLVNGHQRREVYKLNVNKCPLCRKPITNYAENRNLMKLICNYSDNKHLLEKQLEEQIKQEAETDTINKLRTRCEILQKQKIKLAHELSKHRKDQKIMDEVLQKLFAEKKRNQKQMDALEEEARLIAKFLNQKKQQMQKIEESISRTEEKKRIVEKTLEPLKNQKQKLEVLEAAKLIYDGK